ncbi:predicted protein [Coccidioides posadasii str. Silveira]|uniref:Predicted protein n=1 Tax=Coccidioides posadasii (strain RMSCC 757 / Silveira) TaxID=443226 RepID=E9CV90_COCPS|nr:predicted protein [Coccidioides posadasii str. Silveira]
MRLLRIFATASFLLVSQANPSLNLEPLNENHCLEVCKAEKPTCPPYWCPEIVYQKGPASQNIKRVKHLLPFRPSIQAANGSTMKKVVPLYERG